MFCLMDPTNLNNKKLDEVLEGMHGRKLTPEESEEAAYNLENFLNVVADIAEENTEA